MDNCEQATVLSVRGRIATVKIEKRASCEGCKICAFKPGKNYVTVKALNTASASEGDVVSIKREKDNRLLASLIVYIIPVVFSCIGLWIGVKLFEKEIFIALLSLAGIAIGYGLVVLLDKIIGKRGSFGTEIVRIISERATQTEDNTAGEN